MKEIFKGALLAVLLMLVLPGCAFHIPPYGTDWESPTIYVTLEVEPDNAVVLLNGKWIGEAYEFSNPDSAIRLASRNNEIIIKKEGFVEEVINLYDYSSRYIKVRIKLLRDNDYAPPAAPVTTPEPGPKPAKPAKDPAYIPKPAPEREMPLQAEDPQPSVITTVAVVLTVTPEESSIYLDGKFWGISPKGGKIENVHLKPGKYVFEVVKPGYKSYKKEIAIAVKKDSTFNLTIDLEKIK